MSNILHGIGTAIASIFVGIASLFHSTPPPQPEPSKVEIQVTTPVEVATTTASTSPTIVEVKPKVIPKSAPRPVYVPVPTTPAQVVTEVVVSEPEVEEPELVVPQETEAERKKRLMADLCEKELGKLAEFNDRMDELEAVYLAEKSRLLKKEGGGNSTAYERGVLDRKYDLDLMDLQVEFSNIKVEADRYCKAAQ